MQGLPYTSPMEAYRQQAGTLYAAAQQRDKKALQFIVQYVPRLQQWGEQALAKYEVTKEDADEALLWFYHFKSWHELEQYTKAVKEDKNIAEFEQAVEAVIAGDTATLADLLKKNPALISMRSIRHHGSTLLIYVAANGVENYRQKTPANAVEVLKLLLAAGADINETAGMYGGGWTVFGLTATSIWPAKAGVLVPLLEEMLAAGARIDDEEGTVVACLANGRPEAAAALVRFGLKLNLEGAAGVGRLDVVRSYFDENGKLKDAALKGQMEKGYMWACEFGQTAVVQFLLDAGINPDMQVDGMAGLHWAVLGAHFDTVKLLIERGASMENENKYGGTVLESTLWSVIHSDPVYRWPDNKADFPAIIETVLQAGAKIREGVIPWIENTDEIPPDKKAPIEKLLKKYSAS